MNSQIITCLVFPKIVNFFSGVNGFVRNETRVAKMLACFSGTDNGVSTIVGKGAVEFGALTVQNRFPFTQTFASHQVGLGREVVRVTAFSVKNLRCAFTVSSVWWSRSD